MPLTAYQTKIKKVKAIIWDGLDATYDAITPIIGRSIKSYVKVNGQDVGTLTIYTNSVDILVVKPGQYIVILDENLGKFQIMNAIDFQQKYEPLTGDSGLIDGDDNSNVIMLPNPDTGDVDNPTQTI